MRETMIKIREIADQLGMSASALVKWETCGLIPPAQRTAFGARFYWEKQVEGVKKAARETMVKSKKAQAASLNRWHKRSNVLWAESFSLNINTSNAAFEKSREQEVARILRKLVLRVIAGETTGLCTDINGNLVGKWEII